MLLDIVQVGDNIQLSYWDKAGKTQLKLIKPSEGDRFCWGTAKPAGYNDITATNWDNKTCYKINRIFDKKWNKNRMYELVDKYLTKEEHEEVFAYNLPDVWFCDIETEVHDGFPSPETAKEKITIIGLCNKCNITVLGVDNVNDDFIKNIQKRIDKHCETSNIKHQYKFTYKKFKDEKDMLSVFIYKLVPKFPILTGWNFTGFDWPYILKRCELYGINVNLASPAKCCANVGKKKFRPYHIGLVDYLEIYKKFTYNTDENLKLDTVGENVAGIKKVQHNESLQDMYENDFEKYVYYNAIDCVLVELIHEISGALNIGLTTSWITKAQALQCTSRTALIENILRIGYYNDGKVLEYKNEKNKHVEFDGAFVKEPIKGLHKNCICNDFASLYPSIMRQFNMSPESYVGFVDVKDIDKVNKLYESKHVITSDGTIYKNDKMSVLNIIITDFYKKRKDFKKTSFKYKQSYYDAKTLFSNFDSNKVNEFLKFKSDFVRDERPLKEQLHDYIEYLHNKYIEYDNYQLGTKVLINAMYGAFGFSSFYFYNPRMAESITHQGKDAILYANKYSDAYYMKAFIKDVELHKNMGIHIKQNAEVSKSCVIYDDTDSQYSSLSQLIEASDWMEYQVWKLEIKNKKSGYTTYEYVSSAIYDTDADAKIYFKYGDLDFENNDIELTQIDPDGREFALVFDKFKMNSFFKTIFDKYAETYRTENILNFELESYSDAGIWLAKKKYVQNIRWTDPNVYYENLSYIKPKGIELAQTTSSKYVKNQLLDLITFIFANKNFNICELTSKLSKIKNEFKYKSINDLSLNKGMNKYTDYVISDTDFIIYLSGTGPEIKGGAFWNYLLSKHPEDSCKYSTLSNANKICNIAIKKSFYNAKKRVKKCDDKTKKFIKYEDIDEPVEYLSYPVGIDPTSFMVKNGLSVDYNTMFKSLILDPINRIVTSMGYSPITISISCMEKLF